MNSLNDIDINKSRQLIYEAIVFVLLLSCIIVRIANFDTNACWWIWIVNYIGMVVAFLNLLVNKLLLLYNKNSKKFKAFFGFIIFMIIILVVLGFGVNKLQRTEMAATVNDVITLFALFFSLSPQIWNGLLNLIIEFVR